MIDSLRTQRYRLPMPGELRDEVTSDCFRLRLNPTAYALAAQALRGHLQRLAGINIYESFVINGDGYRPRKRPVDNGARESMRLHISPGQFGELYRVSQDAGQTVDAYLLDGINLLHDMMAFEIPNPFSVTTRNNKEKRIRLMGFPLHPKNVLRTEDSPERTQAAEVLNFDTALAARAGSSRNNYGA